MKLHTRSVHARSAHSFHFHALALSSVLSTVLVAHAGGYVDGTQVITPATSIAVPGSTTILPVPTFNNATLTNQNTIAEANNDRIKTPSSADPISTVTGNNYHDETDFVIKGRAGLNYAFTRTYNSTPSSTKVDLGLGYGWVHSYGMRLKSNDYGQCPNCTAAQDPVNGNSKTSSITYTDERGGDHNYLVNESTFAVTAPQGEFDSLVLDSPSTGQHTLTFRNGTKYIFETPTGTLKSTPNVVARLKQIADPWGNQLNFTYNAAGRLATVTDNLGITGRTGLVFAYDGSNHLQTITDWSGRVWHYAVGSDGNFASYTDPLAQTRLYGYVINTHNLAEADLPLRGVLTRFMYYQNGRTYMDADALYNTETLDYDLYRKSTRITDPRGGVREYLYDNAGRLTQLTEADGAILQFQNQADGLRYSKTDGIGYLTQYSYKADKSFNTASDTFGNVTREQDALLQNIDTTYGIYDQVATVKDKRGTTATTTFYSGSGTCIAAGKPNTVTISTLGGTANVKLKSYCWNSDGTLASQTDYLSPTDTTKTRVTSYTYETTGGNSAAHLNVQSLTVTGWDGATVTKTYTYDTLGRAQTETLNRRISPSNAATTALTTTTTWDALDRVIQTQDPAGNLAINRFDANGQLWQVTHKYKTGPSSYDTRNVVTRTFDAADRVLTETDAAGGITSYTYDAAGNVLTVTDPDKHTLQYQYDEMNRRTAVTDANGRTVKTTYDLAGHPITVTNGNGETTTTAYDKLGRPVSVTDPHGYVSTLAYDANNNLTCAIDANAQAGLQPKNSDTCTVSTQYDELNRPTQVKDALNGLTQTSYDLLGNPVARIDAEGRKYSWTYDGLGRLTSETDFAGNSTGYVRDEAGNPWQLTNRLAEVTKTTFDTLNRPTNLSYLKDGTSETLSYEPAGNLVGAANATVSYTLAYDSLNRLTSKVDSRGRSLGFTWDKSGHVLTKTTYQGSTTSYTYDGAGTLVAVSNPDYLTVNYQYDNAGRLLSRVMSSGAKSLYAYDTGGWLTGLTHTDAVGATVTSQSYTRDRVGNITAINQTAGPITGSTNYTLDALYRLTQVDAPGTANDEAFSYDHLGNRLIATRGSTTAGATGTGITSKYSIYTAATQTGTLSGYTPVYNNRLKEIRIGSVGGTIDSGFTFDNEGRLTAQTGTSPRTLTWDAKGRLKTLTQGGSTETYSYDPSNHRIRRSGGVLGTLDYYLEGEHLESLEQSGSLTEKYFRGSTIDELVAGYTTQAGKLTPFMFQHDKIMSVTAETKPNGGTQATLSYFAFGESQATTGTAISRLQFTGRENDGNGLYFYRARYYDPKFGFISEDPKKFAAGQNFYAYCENSPIGCNDPTGMAALADFLSKGIKVINQYLETHPKTGVPFNGGFPDFSSVAIKEVKVPNLTGNRQTDEKLANAASGITGGTPSGYTWHHVEDGTTMQLVPIDVHSATGHTGGAAWLKAGGAAAGLGIAGNADASTGGGLGITWADVKSFVIDLLTDPSTYYTPAILLSPGNAGGALYGPGTPYPTRQDYNNSLGPTSSLGGGAAGGFLLYPNKPNTNQMQSVYGK